MALYQPSNLTPSSFAGIGGGVVDVNDPMTVSWQLNGNSPMRGFTLSLYRIDTIANAYTLYLVNNPTYISTISTQNPNGIYGTDEKGNPIFYTYNYMKSDGSAGTWQDFYYQITNGNEYAYELTLFYSGNVYEYLHTGDTEDPPVVAMTYEGRGSAYNETTGYTCGYKLESGDRLIYNAENRQMGLLKNANAENFANRFFLLAQTSLAPTYYTATANTSDYAFVQQYSPSVFVTNASPSLTVQYNGNPLTADIVIPAAVADFTAEYTQAQGIGINYMQWKIGRVTTDTALDSLTDSDVEVAEDTGIVYTGLLKFSYEGMIIPQGQTSVKYAVRCAIETSNGQQADTGWVGFTVQYAMSDAQGGISVACHGDHTVLSWGEPIDIPGTLNKGSVSVKDSKITLTDGQTVTWDKIKKSTEYEPIDFKAPFSAVWNGDIQAPSSAYDTIPENSAQNYTFSADGKFAVVHTHTSGEPSQAKIYQIVNGKVQNNSVTIQTQRTYRGWNGEFDSTNTLFLWYSESSPQQLCIYDLSAFPTVSSYIVPWGDAGSGSEYSGAFVTYNGNKLLFTVGYASSHTYINLYTLSGSTATFVSELYSSTDIGFVGAAKIESNGESILCAFAGNNHPAPFTFALGDAGDGEYYLEDTGVLPGTFAAGEVLTNATLFDASYYYIARKNGGMTLYFLDGSSWTELPLAFAGTTITSIARDTTSDKKMINGGYYTETFSDPYTVAYTLVYRYSAEERYGALITADYIYYGNVIYSLDTAKTILLKLSKKNSLDPTSFSATVTTNGLTYTNNGNGIIGVTGTSTGSARYTLQNFAFTQNHKYFIVASFEDSNIQFEFTTSSTVRIRGYGFHTHTGDDATVACRLLVFTNQTIDATATPAIYDLTEIYGAGNEPETLEDFYGDLELVKEQYGVSLYSWNTRIAYVEFPAYDDLKGMKAELTASSLEISFYDSDGTFLDGEITPVDYTQFDIQTVTIYGKQVCDYVYLTASTTPLYSPSGRPFWDDNTYMIADFLDASLQGGTSSNTGATYNAIYRTSLLTGKSVLIAKLPTSITSVSDYGTVSKESYIYTLFYVDQSGTYSSPISSDNICIKSKVFTLLEATQNENEPTIYNVVKKWKFGNNVEGGTYATNNEPQFLTNFTKYPFRQPMSQAAKGGVLQAMLSNVSNTKYSDTVAEMESLYNVSESLNTFFLKDIKGNLYMVGIEGAVSQTINNASPLQEVTISVGWREIGDATGISIIESEG